MYFIGIDVSKDRLDGISCDDNGVFNKDAFQIANSPKAIEKFLAKYASRGYTPKNTWVCFEHTGSYSLLLSCLLEQAGYRFSMLPPLEVKRSLGITRGKDDRIDAKRLAEYGVTKKSKLKATVLPSKKIQKIKEMLSLRKQLVKTRTGFINSAKDHRIYEQVLEDNEVSSICEGLIEDLDERIEQVDGRIKELLYSDENLKKNYVLLKSVKGIGAQIATQLITHTQNFTCFDNPRKFLCYTGLAPFPNQSGTKQGRTKTSSLRHRYLRSLLQSGVCSAIRHDPELRRYYKRKTAEGKKDFVVKNAVGCKLIYRAFAVVRRQQEFVQHGLAN